MSFLDKWSEAVDKKNSVLCAGLDPAEFAMGRGEKGLPSGTSKLSWATQYIRAIAPYCAAVKPNLQYWKAIEDMVTLHSISATAHDLGLVVIDDSKLADIGESNDAGIFYAKQRADAVTFSPFAGNIEEAIRQADARNLGLISMCLMSNPQYAREKMKLVPLQDEVGSYDPRDFVNVNGINHVRQYIQLAHDADAFGASGIVVGAPSDENHIDEEEMRKVRSYVSGNMLILLPGVGAQGGEAGKIWKFFDKDHVIVNVGRSLMFPNGSNSTPEEQATTAKQYQEMLNKLRK